MQLSVKYEGIAFLLFEQLKELVCVKIPFFYSHQRKRIFKSLNLLDESANAAPSWPEMKFHNFAQLYVSLRFFTELSPAFERHSC